MTDADLEELELRFASTLTAGGGLRAFGRAVVAAEHDRLAKLLTPTTAELTLMAGEMTAQELRTVRAVLGGIAARVGR